MKRLLIAGSLIMTSIAPARAYAAQSGQVETVDARQVALSAPQSILGLDTDQLKGQVTAVAWSPDGNELYLQASTRDRRGAVTSLKHYVVSVTSKSLKGVNDQPVWASQYWAWKSAQVSPAAPAFKITVESREETKQATAAVGDMAKGGGGGADGRGGIPGTSGEEAGAVAMQSQVVTVYALKAKGATIGEWINEPVIPGLNFGWAPAPARLLAYTKRDGGAIVVLDEQGRKQELTGPKDAILPAWSADGRRLAWLEKRDRKKFDLTIAEISTR